MVLELRHEHYVGMLARCWDDARLAGLPVWIELDDGRVLRGVPEVPSGGNGALLADTDISASLRLGGEAFDAARVLGYGVRLEGGSS